MTTATISSRGQIVIPAPIRKQMGLQQGDRLAFHVDEGARKLTAKRIESLPEMRARFTSLIEPGITPLVDTKSVFNERQPRL